LIGCVARQRGRRAEKNFEKFLKKCGKLVENLLQNIF